MGRLKEEN